MTLQTSDRINLIKEIGFRLYNEEWHVIDLTLRHFGLPTSETWEGTKDAYVMKIVTGATDEVLVELARHVDIEFDASPATLQPEFWAKGRFRLFISHLAIHRAEAAEIQGHLNPKSVSSFVAHNDIAPTQEWQDAIEAALATCDAMLVLMREGFHASYWTDQEIGYAMGRRLLIITVRLGQDPYGFIGRFQALNGLGKEPSRIASAIYSILCKNKKTNKAMAHSLVQQLETSVSFASARENAAMLHDATYWDATLSRRCEYAFQENDHFGEAYGVRPLFDKRIAEHK